MSRLALPAFAFANVLLYAALAALYPLGPGLLKPRLSWAQQADGDAARGIAQAAIYLVAFALFILAAERIIRAGRARSMPVVTLRSTVPLIALIVSGWLVCSLVLLPSFPGESTDIFDYIFRGRMMTEYSLSPLNTTPAVISNKPFHRYISWSQWVDAYGPLWEYASAAVSRLAGSFASPAELRVIINQTCDVQPAVCSLLAKYIAGYRLFAIVLAGICGLIIFSMVLRQTSNPLLASAGLVLWLWNPLVIVSTAAGGHNDVLMMVFVLLCIRLAQDGRWTFALLMMIAGAHVKITAIVVLPVLCLWMADSLGWRRATAITVMTFAIALPMSYLLYQPLGGWETLPRNLHERTLISVNSPVELAYRFLRESLDLTRPAAQRLASRGALFLFALACIPILVAAVQAARRRATRDDDWPQARTSHWLSVMTLVSIVYFALGSYWFQAWYLVLPAALAALLIDTPLSRVTIAYCAGALLASLVTDYLRAGEAVAGWVISMIGVMLTLVPALFASTMPKMTLRLIPWRSSR